MLNAFHSLLGCRTEGERRDDACSDRGRSPLKTRDAFRSSMDRSAASHRVKVLLYPIVMWGDVRGYERVADFADSQGDRFSGGHSVYSAASIARSKRNRISPNGRNLKI
jgi:hypothetical protein